MPFIHFQILRQTSRSCDRDKTCKELGDWTHARTDLDSRDAPECDRRKLQALFLRALCGSDLRRIDVHLGIEGDNFASFVRIRALLR
jgi:hypothetical protein